ncbi:helix-turn-helix domain-containing protein [Streptomyces sp. NPDC059218]|uniref:helix-turn-helix domain-containing protein n=1 Tax=unclassified Streptomyces TaxID=2593676 RepID=UPI00368C6486
MDAQQKPAPPPEAVLIEEARKRARISGRKAAQRADISPTRWAQIITGYQAVGGNYIPVRAPDVTVARMARATGVTADQLRDAGRPDAADAFADLFGPTGTPSPVNLEGAEGAQAEAIATLLASLSPEGREYVLSRFQNQPPDPAPADPSADTPDIRHRRVS